MRKIYIVVTAAVLLAPSFSCASYREHQLESQGNRLISEIESFQKDHGRLPESLNEIGRKETESGPIYYRKENKSKYVIWFGTQLGDSVTYDSDTKEWEP
jgi:hypothetical protein